MLMAWFLLHTLCISIDGLWDRYEKADAALILGNTVYPDGQMSDRLRRRVDKGLELYQNGWVRKLVVSGGLGKEGYYEAEVMKRYLLANGANEADIIVDNEGNTTYLSALNYRRISRQYGLRSVIAVSQFHHISRTRLALQKCGLKPVYAAHPAYFELRDLYALVREFFGYYRYLLKG